MEHTDELLERYRIDHDRRAYERLVETHRSLVSSVCRRLLRDPNDVEDVVQETFLKLAQRINSVNTSLGGWLMATARAASLNLIRREFRERNRRVLAARTQSRPMERLAAHEAIRTHLHEAIAGMEPSARELLIERFLNKTPLGVLAVRFKYSVPTASRKVAAALQQLAQQLREMGASAADDQSVASYLGQTDSIDDGDHGGLRFAPDWRCESLSPLGVRENRTFLPGWMRPLRVGIMISYESTQIIGVNDVYVGTKWQVHSAAFFPTNALQLVGVVEPGTVHRGAVESTLRDYAILGGLIEADDPVALGTLDVLLLGISYAMSPSIARAINQAVRNGMGLLNEYWICSHPGVSDDSAVREIMLADSPIYRFHTKHTHGTCASPLPATVRREHKLLPGLHVGDSLVLRGCGPVYRVLPSAQVLITKDRLISSAEHGIDALGTLQMPCYILGQLGRGRVAVVHAWPHQWFSRHLNVSSETYYLGLLSWLARSDA